MSTNVPPIEAVGALMRTDLTPSANVGPALHSSFSQMLLNGIDHVDKLQAQADKMVNAFALDDSIPPHRVMFALEEAHGALQMLMQVRARVVEGYQELMRLQL